MWWFGEGEVDLYLTVTKKDTESEDIQNPAEDDTAETTTEVTE